VEVRCESFRRYAKNTLQGFAVLVLPQTGLRISDCPVHEKNGASWVSFPARPYQSADGTTAWARLIDFIDAESKRAFQLAAMAAVRQAMEEEAEPVPF
jgi:hypothetical protein